MADKMASEERAFLSDSIPVNAYPFLNRMVSILREKNCNNFPSLPEEAKVDFKACLWVLNAQVYGQAGTINQSAEWTKLSQAVGYVPGAVDLHGLRAQAGLPQRPFQNLRRQGPEMTKGKR